jgi:glutamate/tyrosine decarboxylase-like PLP-dependent enzyme
MTRLPSSFELLQSPLEALEKWKSQWPEFQRDETLSVPEGKAREVLLQLVDRLRENYPFFHPDYAGQMLKPPHLLASTAYFIAQQINPNNHALDGGPATAKMENEVTAELANMFGYRTFLGHLTSSGTIANLEALWIARSIHPERAIAFSREAHYTHSRMCEVIGARAVEIAVDGSGCMDVDDLREKLGTHEIGTVVATTGTTPLGAVDPLDKILEMSRNYDFRVHVDAAYGGFFRLLANSEAGLKPEDARAFQAISRSDSVVVDPHKHGLQPYGCGSILFRDPSIGRYYKHDSPYTYFTSTDLHLGEISLECSRAGAAAAALWTTLKCFPLDADSGIGAVLRKTRAAAIAWSQLIEESGELALIVNPSLDIVTFVPRSRDLRVSTMSELSERLFASLMEAREEPVYLAKFTVTPPVGADLPGLIWDRPALTGLRSVLMKPEHLDRVPSLHQRVLQARAGIE